MSISPREGGQADGAREALEQAAQLMETHDVVWQDAKIIHTEVSAETVSPAMRMRARAIRAIGSGEELSVPSIRIKGETFEQEQARESRDGQREPGHMGEPKR